MLEKTMSHSLSLEEEVPPEVPTDEVHSCLTDQVNLEIPNRDATILGQTNLLRFCLSEQNGSEFA